MEIDNILINKDGIIFHIDFGFIMGETPIFRGNLPKLKWNYNLVEPILGNKKNPKEDSKYKELIEITFKGFEIIRK